MKNNQRWIAFLLKDKCACDAYKEVIKADIMKKFKRKQSDICYSSFDIQSGLSYYFFVKEYGDNDLREIWQSNINNFQPYNSHTKISEQQLFGMLHDVNKCNYGYVKFGDIVLIDKGIYNKLHGIVLRQNRNGKFDVGLKFCFGSVVQSYDYNDLSVIGNIFNYIKVIN